MLFFYPFLMKNIHEDDRSFSEIHQRERERDESREETEYMTKL